MYIFFKPMYNIELHIIFKTYARMQGPSLFNPNLNFRNLKKENLTLEIQGRRENYFLKLIICETPRRH